MIEHAHVHQAERLLEPRGQRPVCRARCRIAARMVVRKNHRRRVAAQGFLDHFARMNLCAVDRAAEHLRVVDQPMARVQEQHREDFVLEAG